MQTKVRIEPGALRDELTTQMLPIKEAMERCGVVRSTFYKVMNGKPITLGTYSKICKGLGVDFKDYVTPVVDKDDEGRVAQSQ